MDIKGISDGQLYEMCRNFGAHALEARRKFVGLLPEVNRRKLYLKHNFYSVFHFAAVLAGVSEEQVRRAINVERKFEDKPLLKQLLTSGEVSVNKLARVAPVATKENESFLADKVQNLSNRGVETLVQDVHVHTNPQQYIEVVNEPPLSDEVKKKLNELARKKIDINQFILEALQKREQEIVEEKEVQAEKAEHKMIEQFVEGKTISHHVPVATKRLLKKEHGEMCSIPFCRNKAVVIHHTNRFSISLSHDPRYLAPLCKQHHEIAHTVDTKVMEKRRPK